jgi:hypothetical protein
VPRRHAGASSPHRSPSRRAGSGGRRLRARRRPASRSWRAAWVGARGPRRLEAQPWASAARGRERPRSSRRSPARTARVRGARAARVRGRSARRARFRRGRRSEPGHASAGPRRRSDACSPPSRRPASPRRSSARRRAAHRSKRRPAGAWPIDIGLQRPASRQRAIRARASLPITGRRTRYGLSAVRSVAGTAGRRRPGARAERFRRNRREAADPRASRLTRLPTYRKAPP